jgi:copper resistance protein C
MNMRHAIAVLAVFLLGLAPEAEGHAFLVKSNPPVGSMVSRGVTELRLQFSEPVELAISGVELINAAGAPVPLNVAFGDSGHAVLAGKTPMLMPGSYRVKWHVVSADTHRTEGSFNFTVKP